MTFETDNKTKQLIKFSIKHIENFQLNGKRWEESSNAFDNAKYGNVPLELTLKDIEILLTGIRDGLYKAEEEFNIILKNRNQFLSELEYIKVHTMHKSNYNAMRRYFMEKSPMEKCDVLNFKAKQMFSLTNIDSQLFEEIYESVNDWFYEMECDLFIKCENNKIKSWFDYLTELIKVRVLCSNTFDKMIDEFSAYRIYL